VAKFSRLAGLADLEDHRVRGAFVFAGGSATGRASSYGAQVHNFTRRCADDPEAVRQAMVRGHAIAPKYGKRVTDVARKRLGDVALLPFTGTSFDEPLDSGSYSLVCRHGSLTDAEIDVPLLAIVR
jgi:hypothetical protein